MDRWMGEQTCSGHTTEYCSAGKGNRVRHVFQRNDRANIVPREGRETARLRPRISLPRGVRNRRTPEQEVEPGLPVGSGEGP